MGIPLKKKTALVFIWKLLWGVFRGPWKSWNCWPSFYLELKIWRIYYCISKNFLRINYHITFTMWGWILVWKQDEFHVPMNHPSWKLLAQLAGTVEYTVYFSAEGKTSSNKCPAYDTKQSDGEVPVMLELLGMWSTSSLPSLPGPLCPGVVALDRALSMGQIELNCVVILNWIAWNRTVLTLKLYLRKTELFEIEQFWYLTGWKQKLYLY